MEAAGHLPHLANPTESKKCMGKPHKHDPLDAKGLGLLLRNGPPPECWIPPKPLRDQRELVRTRMCGTARQVNQYLKWAFVEAATCAVKLHRYRQEHIGGCIAGSSGSVVMAGPSWRWLVIWRKRVTGC